MILDKKTNKFINYYKVLGVSPHVNADTIKASYRRLAMKYHPDHNPNMRPKIREQAQSYLRQINEAYHFLGDAQRRKTYDLIIQNHAKTLPINPIKKTKNVPSSIYKAHYKMAQKAKHATNQTPATKNVVAHIISNTIANIIEIFWPFSSQSASHTSPHQQQFSKTGR